MATMKYSSSTSTSVKVTVSSFPSGTDHLNFYIGTSTSSMPKDGFVTVGSSKSKTYTFSDLLEDEAYYLKVSPRDENDVALETATTVFMIVQCYGSTRKVSLAYLGESFELSSPSLTNYTLKGFSTNPEDLNIEYEKEDEVEEAVVLYAVFSKNTHATFYYGKYGSLLENYRYIWRVQTDTTSTAYVMTNSETSTRLLDSVPKINDDINAFNYIWEGVGWEDSKTSTSNYSFEPGETLTSSEINSLKTSYYALYSREVTISYDSNGGTGTMSDSTGNVYYNCGAAENESNCVKASITISGCNFTGPNNNIFAHWNTSSDDSGTDYSPAGKISTLTDKTLYAIWKIGKLTLTYRDGSESQQVVFSGNHTIRGGFKADYTFVGWSTELSSPAISYIEGGTISWVSSENASQTLYAVYEVGSTEVLCYYIKGSTNTLDSNKREKKQYRCNTSNTNTSKNFYGSITLPSFSSINSSITTSKPARSWTAVGWRNDATAGKEEYGPGVEAKCDANTNSFYAIYSNKCSITYNPGRGTGKEIVDSQTAYYNASGTYTKGEFIIKECTFTPPTGEEFYHWNQISDGTGIKYEVGALQETSFEVIFYAIWRLARPQNWSWPTHSLKPIEQWSAMNFTGSGENIVPNPLTAKEWLDFISRIQDFAKYCNVTLSSDYLSKAKTGVSKGKNMKIEQANGVRNLIYQLNNYIDPNFPVPDEVTKENPIITANFINGLMYSLNSIYKA